MDDRAVRSVQRAERIVLRAMPNPSARHSTGTESAGMERSLIVAEAVHQLRIVAVAGFGARR